ncbi:MAG: Bacterial alpha-L-rhamnosidase [Lentisphaerae bacterium ADurb.Bin242]|nr:MAG: Bacterial alpha-L-rhamnosidase [Lentisphaerae bacterium ADurb.Bin242]
MMTLLKNTKWIWTSAEDAGKDIYRCFCKKFAVDAEFLRKRVFLEISADSFYTVFLNGVRCTATQFSDVPPQKTLSVIDITDLLHEGENRIAVRVHYIGEAFFTYCPGEPGLYALIRSGETFLEQTGSDWKCAPDPTYHSGLCTKLTRQLGYVFEYDASKEDLWFHPGFDDSAWAFTQIPDFAPRTLEPRPVPFLKELPCPEVKIVQAGYIRRFSSDKKTFAESVSGDYMLPGCMEKLFENQTFSEGSSCLAVKLRPDNSVPLTFTGLEEQANGYYLIADLGRETVGYIHLRLNASLGTVVDIAHGEHLDDGRVRAANHGRNFADRFLCREGENVFLHPLRRIGARYLELHVTNLSGPFSVLYAGVVPVELPLPEKEGFHTDDRLFQQVHKVAADTLKLCMHEHYEDCPWREQALYPYDSRNQILYAYSLWGNYDFAAASLDLLGRSYGSQGYLGIVSPSKKPDMLAIPSFTMVWITELYEHFLHTGSLKLFQKFIPVVDDILDKALARRDPESTLYFNEKKANIWNFYEWTENLSRQDTFPQSPYNLYLREALLSAASLHEADGNRDRAVFLRDTAASLGTQIERTFRDPEAGGYSTLLPGKVRLNEHVQVLMLFHNLVPEDRVRTVFESLCSGKLVPISYSALSYFVRALMPLGPEARAFVEKTISEQFEPPVLSGATSLWETAFGADDFAFAGSLCHAWSSIHVYYAGAYVLGVTPLAPGFRKFSVRPCPGRLLRASGAVPTPSGDIRVSWTQTPAGLALEVEHPAELEPVFDQYPEFPVASILCNGKTLL